MPIFNVLRLDPFTRVNDAFVMDHSIDAGPIASPNRPAIIDSPPHTNQTRYQADFYKHIACDLVVETVLDYPYPYVSEKTLRPISCKRMFLILGPAGILSLLHQKGFCTFDDIIDESYDTIQDPCERFHAVMNQAEKFCDRPLQEIVQYLKDNQSRLERNFQNLKNLQTRELHELELSINGAY
jgi:hypothetical protein